MVRLIRRIAVLAVLGGVAATVAKRFVKRDDCTPSCDCSLGSASCSCGHATCLAPAAAA
jgi:hypothetical protein